MTISGSCLCGGITYSTEAAPVLAGNCHCFNCKRTSGSGYSPTLFFPAQAVNITGQPKYYESMGESGHLTKRGFCPDCGSQILGIPGVMPGLLAIRAGTLDEPEKYRPQMDIFTSRACSWDAMDPDLPKFPEFPPTS